MSKIKYLRLSSRAAQTCSSDKTGVAPGGLIGTVPAIKSDQLSWNSPVVIMGVEPLVLQLPKREYVYSKSIKTQLEEVLKYSYLHIR